MHYSVRTAHKSDMPEVLSLIQELASYENEPDAVKINLNDLERDGFGEEALFNCFVVEMDGTVRGMALFYLRYSTWVGKTVHLEDLVVERNYRGNGLGRALYIEIMRYAKKENVKRVEWSVLKWNTSAIEFYKSTGAMVFEDWRTVQFDEKSYVRFLKNS